METKLYNERHTKSVLDGERQVVFKKVSDHKGQNAQMSREISRNKMFNKKDEDRKAKKDQMDKLQAAVKERNARIEEHDIALDKERRVFKDKLKIARKKIEDMEAQQWEGGDNNGAASNINLINFKKGKIVMDEDDTPLY